MSNENNQNKLNFFVINDVYTACGVIEGFVDIPKGADHDDTMRQAWQYLIDSGAAWTLQGWYGRNAQTLIREGVCTPPKS